MTRRPDYAPVQSHGPLFDPPERHLSGRTDPQTSREAAAGMLEAGALGNDQRAALALVVAYPGSTCKELGHLACRVDEEDEHARQRIGRRLNELTNPPDSPNYVPGKPHLIERRGTRDGCACWWPVERS